MSTFIHDFLKRHRSLRRILKLMKNTFFPVASVSTDYVYHVKEQAEFEFDRLRSAWKSDLVPKHQRQLVDKKITRFRAGKSVNVFDTIVQALRSLKDIPSDATLLEVGCSSGFYSEVLTIANFHFKYEGCDYSDAFIAMAKEKYPEIHFQVENATQLSYADNSFDIFLSGCCLLHIPEYEVAIKETARVARHYAIFHRTPVLIGKPTSSYTKQAYGVEFVEIHFNETEFLALLGENGLLLFATYTLDEDLYQGIGTATRTYVCRKT